MEEKLSDVVTVLDCDLILHSFIVNEEKKCFDPLDDPLKLVKKLKIDSQWLRFNDKPLVDFETYKKDYKLFSDKTLGVVIENSDFIVFYNIDS